MSSSSQPLERKRSKTTKRLRRPSARLNPSYPAASPKSNNIGATKSPPLRNVNGSEGVSSDDDDLAMWVWKNHHSTGKRKKFIVSPSCSTDEHQENEKPVTFSSSGGNEKEKDFGKNTKKNDVGAWLSRLELEKYASLFQAHEVDEAVLPFLTIDDLKDMGISAVGTRRKMLCSIEKFAR